MKDGLTLHDLGVGPNGAVQMEISSADPVANPLKSLKPKPSYIMPDVITVKVQRGKWYKKHYLTRLQLLRYFF